MDVPTTLCQERLVEVPQDQVAELVRPVSRAELQEWLGYSAVTQKVVKHVMDVRESIVEVPKMQTVEVVDEIAGGGTSVGSAVVGDITTMRGAATTAEVLPEQPTIVEEVVAPAVQERTQRDIPLRIQDENVVGEVPQAQIPHNIVEAPQLPTEQEIVDVPTTLYQEKLVEVLQAQVAKVVRPVSRAEFQEATHQVAKPVMDVRESIAEAPEMQTVEDVTQVPKASVQQVPKQFPDRGHGNYNILALIDCFVRVNRLNDRGEKIMRELSAATARIVMGTNGKGHAFEMSDSVRDPTAVLMARIRNLRRGGDKACGRGSHAVGAAVAAQAAAR